MRTAPEDRKAAAIIRDAAIELFAERGITGVTIREIAAAAGVSPSLVIHHFGSKAGLGKAVDEHVADAFAELLAELAPSGGGGSLTALLAERLAREPALLSYLRRLLVDGGGGADRLFGLLFETTLEGVDALSRAGVVRRPADRAARAAVLLANDLAVILLRRQIEHALGADPLAGEGLARWSTEVLDLYTNGLFSLPVTAKAAPARRSGSAT